MAAPFPPIPRPNAWLAASGALLAAISVALAAYASHAMQGPAQARLQLAAVFAFGHGLALAALAPSMPRGLGQVALAALAAGVLLFSGSLAGAALAQWPTTLAPLGGMLMIGAWLALAFAFLRR
ncbi:DUF423 domain-containing protein [Cognatiluteimonas profundi]|uniref:DUF423 domain-containing protein n=1 Tax=Cognatiluteimonas profundi TaxID=2594501 RepID=UPI00131BBAA7|nr:DUF423 domain-containing protein [Lysobacter profundi]